MALRIGIVGGGMAGLVLARVLNEGGMPSVVLERDAGRTARTQGGSLDLHPESGQRALLLAGLIAPFHEHARPQGDEIRILDPAGREHLRHGGSAPAQPEPDADGILAGRPEIDRADLRDLLLDSLPDDIVRWDKQVTHLQPRPAGGYEVIFADGGTDEFDILVGADGAHSRVRPLLTDVAPTPLGVTTAWVWLRHLSTRPEIADFIGQGSLWCLGDNLDVGAQRGARDDARVSVLARGDGIAADATKDALLALVNGWSPRIRNLIEAADDEVSVHVVETTPIGRTWPAQPDVTLIGDAAHLLPPVGEGANHAMLDAAELGRALLAHPDDPAAAIRSAECAMFERIRPVAEESARIQDSIVAPDALARMLRFFGA